MVLIHLPPYPYFDGYSVPLEYVGTLAPITSSQPAVPSDHDFIYLKLVEAVECLQ